MSRPAKAAFLSTAHPHPFDTRVFHREARSLRRAGYEVVSITQHDREEVVDGIRIVPLRRPRNRLDRMTLLAWSLLGKALRERANVYHLHVPELLPIGLLLKLLGKRVIYDAHEMYADKLRCRLWIPRPLRPLVSRLFYLFERSAALCLDHVITADRYTAETFWGARVTPLANYALPELRNGRGRRNNGRPPRGNETVVIYAGMLTAERGLHVMLEAMRLLRGEPVRLRLLGKFADPSDEKRVSELANAAYLGFQSLDGVYRQLSEADAGLMLLQPVPAYLYASENVNKLFEYMACGLAVIASDFPGIARIVNDAEAGWCVEPTSPAAVAEAILRIAGDRMAARRLGENGRAAVAGKYNWERESKKLLLTYARVLGGWRVDEATVKPEMRPAANESSESQVPKTF